VAKKISKKTRSAKKSSTKKRSIWYKELMPLIISQILEPALRVIFMEGVSSIRDVEDKLHAFFASEPYGMNLRLPREILVEALSYIHDGEGRSFNTVLRGRPTIRVNPVPLPVRKSLPNPTLVPDSEEEGDPNQSVFRASDFGFPARERPLPLPTTPQSDEGVAASAGGTGVPADLGVGSSLYDPRDPNDLRNLIPDPMQQDIDPGTGAPIARPIFH